MIFWDEFCQKLQEHNVAFKRNTCLEIEHKKIIAPVVLTKSSPKPIALMSIDDPIDFKNIIIEDLPFSISMLNTESDKIMDDIVYDFLLDWGLINSK